MIVIKPKWRGWKEGVLMKDLQSYGGTILKKGQIVRYKRHKEFDTENSCWTGKYEWHYLDQSNYNLIRSNKLLVKE